jgi:uncharacterized protein (DUF736 family)
MAVIGVLQPNREGGWTGSIFLMAHDVKIRFVPNDNQIHPKAPAFRVFAGTAELGAVWRETTKEENSQEFLGGTLDFPGLDEPISVAVFFSDDRTKARAVWKRRSIHGANGADAT